MKTEILKYPFGISSRNKLSVNIKGSKISAQDFFDKDGEIELIRIIYENDGFNFFDFFKIGNDTFTYAEYGLAYYNPPSATQWKIKDIPLNVKYKNGDVFVFESRSNIEKIELFIK